MTDLDSPTDSPTLAAETWTRPAGCIDGECVETRITDVTIEVRNSRAKGQWLTFSRDEWAAHERRVVANSALAKAARAWRTQIGGPDEPGGVVLAAAEFDLVVAVDALDRETTDHLADDLAEAVALAEELTDEQAGRPHHD